MSRRVELVLDIDHVYGLRDSLSGVSPYGEVGRWFSDQSWRSPLLKAIVECLEAEEDGERSAPADLDRAEDADG